MACCHDTGCTSDALNSRKWRRVLWIPPSTAFFIPRVIQLRAMCEGCWEANAPRMIT
jgi:hypothetical protein